MPILQALISRLSATSTLKGSIILAVLSCLGFLYTSYTGMAKEVESLKLTNEVLYRKVTILSDSLELQIRNQKQADSMYLELKSVYATLDKKLVTNQQLLIKLKQQKGTQNEQILNTPLTRDIIDIANDAGVRQ